MLLFSLSRCTRLHSAFDACRLSSPLHGQEETLALVVKDAIAALINLTTDDELAMQIMYGGKLSRHHVLAHQSSLRQPSSGIMDNLVRRILSSEEEHPDACCMLLVNLTRYVAAPTGTSYTVGVLLGLGWLF